jgi:hypothetical protein
MVNGTNQTSLSARPMAPMQAYSRRRTFYRLILRDAAFTFSDALGCARKYES